MSSIKLKHASGNSMSLAAPATNPASDLSLKLPATIGAAGQILKNGSTAGTLEFGGVPSMLATSSSYEGLELQTPSGDASGEFHIGVHDSGGSNGRSIVFKRGGSDGMDTTSFKIYNDGGWSVCGDNQTTSNGSIGRVYKFFADNNNLNIGLETPTADKSAIFERRRTGRSGNARLAQLQLYENSSSEGGVMVYGSSANSDISGGVYMVGGGTSWGSLSDTRLKDKTGDITNALTDIAKIETLKFTWKNETVKTPRVGVTAQSVEPVVPEAIETLKLPYLEEKGDDTEYMSVRYTELIPLCIEALKEAKTKIETLEAKVAALEAG